MAMHTSAAFCLYALSFKWRTIILLSSSTATGRNNPNTKPWSAHGSHENKHSPGKINVRDVVCVGLTCVDTCAILHRIPYLFHVLVVVSSDILFTKLAHNS